MQFAFISDSAGWDGKEPSPDASLWAGNQSCTNNVDCKTSGDV